MGYCIRHVYFTPTLSKAYVDGSDIHLVTKVIKTIESEWISDVDDSNTDVSTCSPLNTQDEDLDDEWELEESSLSGTLGQECLFVYKDYRLPSKWSLEAEPASPFHPTPIPADHPGAPICKDNIEISYVQLSQSDFVKGLEGRWVLKPEPRNEYN
jgi:hypothetical protein